MTLASLCEIRDLCILGDLINALARVRGPAEALAAIAPLERDPKLRRYHLLLAVRGQLLMDLGRTREASLECAGTEPERRFLGRTLDACR